MDRENCELHEGVFGTLVMFKEILLENYSRYRSLKIS